MSQQSEQAAHKELVSGGYTSLHYHRRKVFYARALNTALPMGYSVLYWNPQISDIGFSYSNGEIIIGEELDGTRIKITVFIQCITTTNPVQIASALEYNPGSDFVPVRDAVILLRADLKDILSLQHIIGTVNIGHKLRIGLVANNIGTSKTVSGTSILIETI